MEAEGSEASHRKTVLFSLVLVSPIITANHHITQYRGPTRKSNNFDKLLPRSILRSFFLTVLFALARRLFSLWSWVITANWPNFPLNDWCFHQNQK